MFLTPETDDRRYYELETPVYVKTAILALYDPRTVVELLASMWAYPTNAQEARRLMDGQCATIHYCFASPDVGLTSLLPAKGQPKSNLHGCDVRFFPHTPATGRMFFLEMLAHDRCFVSRDVLSTEAVQTFLQHDDCDGIFTVYQVSEVLYPRWSTSVWKAIGCEIRPHDNLDFGFNTQ